MKYDIDYADSVGMWELLKYDEMSEQWECLHVYAEDKKTARWLISELEKGGI